MQSQGARADCRCDVSSVADEIPETKTTAELDREREERKKAELSVVQLERQLATIKEQCSQLDVEIEQKRAIVMELRRGRFLRNSSAS
jgi:predicted RNase H-like nuclease (RuvC/YqgF family)